MSKLSLLAACAIFTAATFPAMAWQPSPIAQGGGINAAVSPASDSGSAAGAAAASSARAHASSHASSMAQGGRATGGTANSTVNVNGSGGGSGGGGGYAQPINPPSVATTNACGGGISLGGFGVGGGGAGGALWELHDCRLRAAAVLLDARGDHDAAKGVWCQISEVKEAYRLTASPCPTEPSQPPAPQVVAMSINADMPDYCYTASAGERRQHLECSQHGGRH